jgi:Dyp-type peroxidase family
MAVTLNSPISWKNAPSDDQTMLENLQPNILKPHTREFLSILFIRFTNQTGARSLLRDVESTMKSTTAHLKEIELFKTDEKKPGTPYVGIGLTATGYTALGISQIPDDQSFRSSMQNTKELNDPALSEWEPHFRNKEDLHAIILIGDSTQNTMLATQQMIVDKISAAEGVVVLGKQDGLGQHNKNGDGIEHFGYVDGRSQPLFFDEDITDEMLTSDGIGVWDPGFPLAQAIVSDPAAPDPALHFGSYFVFRKLEQNVRQFKEAEKKFAFDLKVEDPERSGGMLVGRFEDGSPVATQFAEGAHNPVPNNFNYDSDLNGTKCPFLGHIRKTNPRGTGGRGDEASERKHLMPRRGQTYGLRTDDPNDGEIKNKPSSGVGLLFMAFNSSIVNQFEFTQINWANSPEFPKVKGVPLPGVDPIIGQTEGDVARPVMTCPVKWGEPGMSTVAPVPRTVKMLGGGYFFMPSLAFLRAL